MNFFFDKESKSKKMLFFFGGGRGREVGGMGEAGGLELVNFFFQRIQI